MRAAVGAADNEGMHPAIEGRVLSPLDTARAALMRSAAGAGITLET